MKRLLRVVTGALFLFTPFSSDATTLYTSLKESKCWTPGKEVVVAYDAQGLDVQECEAVKGWRVFIASTDERSWLDFHYRDETWTTEKEVVYNNDFGDFPNIGESMLEWTVDSMGKPSSAIFRIYAQKPASEQKLSRLFVVDVSQYPPAFCGMLKTNEAARELVGAARKCVRPLAAWPLHRK